jgi:hypothetical protein
MGPPTSVLRTQMCRPWRGAPRGERGGSSGGGSMKGEVGESERGALGPGGEGVGTHGGEAQGREEPHVPSCERGEDEGGMPGGLGLDGGGGARGLWPCSGA